VNVLRENTQYARDNNFVRMKQSAWCLECGGACECAEATCTLGDILIHIRHNGSNLSKSENPRIPNFNLDNFLSLLLKR
jgi:hypothetical protein